MRLYGAVVLMVTLSTACGLNCYKCYTRDVETCTEVETCLDNFDRCATLEVNGVITKSCFFSSACEAPIKCCKGDLCNGAKTTGDLNNGAKTTINLCNSAKTSGSSVLLLLVSSAIMAAFL